MERIEGSGRNKADVLRGHLRVSRERKKKQETEKLLSKKRTENSTKADRVFKMAKTDALRVTCASCGKVKWVMAQDFKYSLTLCRSSNLPGTLPISKSGIAYASNNNLHHPFLSLPIVPRSFVLNRG